MDPLTFHTKFSVEDFDSQYNLRSKRPDYESTVIPEWIERSGKVRSDFSGMLDIRYGAGQKQQLDLFRVIDVTGYCNDEGVKSRGNRRPNKLFYDSKEQYIEHRLRNIKRGQEPQNPENPDNIDNGI